VSGALGGRRLDAESVGAAMRAVASGSWMARADASRAAADACLAICLMGLLRPEGGADLPPGAEILLREAAVRLWRSDRGGFVHARGAAQRDRLRSEVSLAEAMLAGDREAVEDYSARIAAELGGPGLRALFARIAESVGVEAEEPLRVPTPRPSDARASLKALAREYALGLLRMNDRPLSPGEIYGAISGLTGGRASQPIVSRALTALVDAREVRRVGSGAESRYSLPVRRPHAPQ